MYLRDTLYKLYILLTIIIPPVYHSKIETHTRYYASKTNYVFTLVGRASPVRSKLHFVNSIKQGYYRFSIYEALTCKRYYKYDNICIYMYVFCDKWKILMLNLINKGKTDVYYYILKSSKIRRMLFLLFFITISFSYFISSLMFILYMKKISNYYILKS